MKNNNFKKIAKKWLLTLVVFLVTSAIPLLAQTDLTQPGGAISESNSNSPSYEGITNLIDNSTSTKYLTFQSSTTVSYNLSTQYVFNGYSLTSANDAPERDPSNWIVEGSNDGVNWTKIDERANNSFNSRKEKRMFFSSNTLAFSKVRFKFNNTSGSIFQLAELEIFGVLPTTGSKTDLTQPNGAISESNNNSPSYESIEKLIDNSKDTKYLTFKPSTTVGYNFSKSYQINGYSLTSANDAPGRDPSNWIVEASNDGVNWYEIDRRSNNSFSGRKQRKEFNFSNSQSFTKVRFKFNNTSGSIFQLAELEVFGDEGTGGGNLPVANFSSDKTSVVEGGQVVFTNTSVNGSQYAWTFEGGTPGSSTATNPTIAYNTKGVYNVTLKVTNAVGVDTEIKNGYITVTANGGTTCDWGNSFLTPNVIFKDHDGVTTGAQVFKQVIPNPVTYMQQRCLDVAQILYRKSENAPKFRQLTFELKNEDFVAYKYGDGDAIGIAVSTQHLARIYQNSGNNPQVIKDEIDGILYHEVTHGYNNSPIVGGTYDGSSPFWAYTEGIADAVRIHAGFHQSRRPDINDGRKWLGGYTITGFFLHYVSQKYDKNFVYKFNKAAKSLGQSWSFDNAFKSIVGKGVQTVWDEYVNFIRNNGSLDYDGNYPWQLDCSEDGANLPVANFSSDKTSVVEGGQVVFTNTSVNGSQYAWTFEGGTPGSSTATNPTIAYNTKGVYNVTLKVTNADGVDTEIKNGYITVTANGGTTCDWGNSFLTPNVIFKDHDGVTTGARIFKQVIPNPVTYMQQRCLDVAQILYRKSENAPKFRQLTFELKNEDFVAYKYGDGDAIGIAVSTQHLARIYQNSGNNPQVIKDEIDGILYHEVTHGYNNSPIVGGTYDGSSPFWAYTEGIADAVRIHAGFHQSRRPDINDGRKWLGGYTITGFFLHYVSQKYDKNFVYKFNKAAKSLGQSWSFDNAFKSIVGKGVQTVWDEYVNFIRNNGSLDYDGNYPWQLDCSENAQVAQKATEKEVSSEVLSEMKIFPNPIQNEVNIVLNSPKLATINVRTLEGFIVYSKENVEFTKGRKVKIDVSLPSGVYLIEIDGVVKKLIVK